MRRGESSFFFGALKPVKMLFAYTELKDVRVKAEYVTAPGVVVELKNGVEHWWGGMMFPTAVCDAITKAWKGKSETTAAMANSALSISALAGLGGLRCSVVRMCTVRSLGATHGSIATLLPRTAVGGSSASSPTLVAVRRLVRRRASSAASAARASGTTLDQRTTLVVVVEDGAAAEPPSRGGCGRASTANGMGRAGPSEATRRAESVRLVRLLVAVPS